MYASLLRFVCRHAVPFFRGTIFYPHTFNICSIHQNITLNPPLFSRNEDKKFINSSCIFFFYIHMLFFERTVKNMNHKKFTNTYDDGNIPDVDLPKDSVKNTAKDSFSSKYDVEPLPESSRPRKDGPGGN